MLHRHEERGLIVVTQPAHAWISGQLATAWGNEAGFDAPRLELRLATEQHDIAWLDWEQAPTLNPRTGLPHAFNEMPTREHLALWSTAMPRALTFGRLPALLISMHGTYLYRRFHDFNADSERDAELARAFLKQEERLQAELVASLEASGDISHSEINLNRRLLSLWDAMSLALCMGFDGAREFPEVPSVSGDVTMRFERASGPGDEFSVAPWPFREPAVHLRCEGYLLDGRFEDQAALRDALRVAPPRSLSFTLRPA